MKNSSMLLHCTIIRFIKKRFVNLFRSYKMNNPMNKYFYIIFILYTYINLIELLSVML